MGCAHMALAFFAGCTFGATLAGVAVAWLTYRRGDVERTVERAVSRVEAAGGPRPEGRIFAAETDADIERERIVERNRREGRDTPIDQLRDRRG